MNASATTAGVIVWDSPDEGLGATLAFNLQPRWTLVPHAPAAKPQVVLRSRPGPDDWPAFPGVPVVVLVPEGGGGEGLPPGVVQVRMPFALDHLRRILESVALQPGAPLRLGPGVDPARQALLDPAARTLETAAGCLHLTDQETRLLEQIARQENPPSAEQLRTTVWDHAPCVSLETMKTTLAALHRKVAPVLDPQGIRLPWPALGRNQP